MMLNDYCDNSLSVLAICQTYSENYSYYYDNYNFVYLKDGNITDSDLTRLKEWNDWDKPLDASKITRVTNSYYPYSKYTGEYDVENSDDNMEKIMRSFISDNVPNIEYHYDLTEIDRERKQLCAVREYTLDSDTKVYTFYKSYFMVLDKNGKLLVNNGIPCVIEVEDIVNCQEDLKAIKEMSGWKLDAQTGGAE